METNAAKDTASLKLDPVLTVGGRVSSTAGHVFGFLAMASFVLDFIIFLKVKGHPFQGAQAPPTTNGAVPPPEAEKLNGDANGKA
ncbi:hypothetical protein CCH79_00019778 [Gambusia affinis]|uniref:Uncharacterized protein n=1 Tax=Gambusia affinis TaxID=33528 RepID=A0A315VBC7_GAMAF|nr:hypothetical protein CCH79_00019778 [Gambusia affinis]